MKEIQLAMPGSRLSMTPETLMIAFDRPRRSLSTAIYGGGFRNIRYALNQKLTAFYPSEKDFPGGSVSSYLKLCALERGAVPEESAVLLTAAKVDLFSHKIIEAGPVLVEAITTGGVEKPPAVPPPLLSTGKKKGSLLPWEPLT